MSKHSTEGFVKEKIDVDQADKVMTFGRREVSKGYDPASGCLFLIGLAGSGREELATLLAEKYALKVQKPKTISSLEDVEVLSRVSGTVVIVPHSAVRDDDIRLALREKGKVFYLMGEVLRMAHRLGMDEQEREVHSALFVEMEPLFMMTLHYILQGWKEPEELVDNVGEMLSMA